MRVAAAHISRPGGRDTNQDRVAVFGAGALTCCVLADGLGGHGGGERAAELAVAAIAQWVAANPVFSPAVLQAALEMANLAVTEGQKERPQLQAMRTTVVILLTDGAGALWAHAGDSRLYYLRAGRTVERTRDHSVPQALVEAGRMGEDQIRGHEDRNRLLKTLGGAKADLNGCVEQQPRVLAPGDSFLLASDGLWEHISEIEMEAELAKAPTVEAWLEGIEKRVRGRSGATGDNYSAIALWVME